MSSKTTIALGVLTALMGCIPLLMMAGVLPRATTPSANPSPAWMGCLIGVMFVSAGLMVILRGAVGTVSDSNGDLPAGAPPVLRLANDTLAVGIVCALALMFSWVAFGPGPRHFSISIGFGGLWMRGFGGGDMMGRVAFGFGAILFWFVAGAFGVAMVRRWRQ